jgi:hypothetical protein
VRSLALAAVTLVIGFGLGWVVFADHDGGPSRHDVEQAVLESGYGTPVSAACRRQAGTDRIWRCMAHFPDGARHAYKVVASSRSNMVITPE